MQEQRRPRTWQWTVVTLALTAFAVVGIHWRLAGADAAPSRWASASGSAPAHTNSPEAPEAAAAARVAGEPRRARAVPAAAPLPPDGTPLAQTYALLSARAAAGDAAAASRLYRDVQRCWRARQAAQFERFLLANLPDEHQDAAVVVQDRVTMRAELRALVENSAGLCAGASKAQVDSLLPAMLRAAQLGDVRATSCYTGGSFGMMTDLIDHPEWLAQMRDAPRMLEDAVRRGDWVAVELLHHAYAGVLRDNPAGQAIEPDRAMDYRYLRLERLGASGTFVQKLDRLLADAAAALTPQQIADGDAWAADAHERYFGGSSSNEASNGANICGSSDD